MIVEMIRNQMPDEEDESLTLLSIFAICVIPVTALL